ncbi:hypothetical protein CF392_02085 [Tamilnaduibacter salinus]|uniref:Uncharacterized protein n=1 Tax=Tamilnaduibacter salinus TaxID=1484056 RepID=A0A2A2I810_9GAMM|nr:hypothetical protein CF392_02085 [Tamilnaduibacter salinus]
MFSGIATADSLHTTGDQANDSASQELSQQSEQGYKKFFDAPKTTLDNNVDIMSDSDMKDTEGGVYGPYVCITCGGRHGGVYSPNYCQWCYYK